MMKLVRRVMSYLVAVLGLITTFIRLNKYKLICDIRYGKRVRLHGKMDFFGSPKISIGNNVEIGNGVYFLGNGRITIGNNVNIGRYSVISASYQVTIGNDTRIAEFVSIWDSNHGIDRNELIREQKSTSGAITIGCDVWIGRGVSITKGVTLYDGCVIGSNSVVTKDIERYTINAGCPARYIKRR